MAILNFPILLEHILQGQQASLWQWNQHRIANKFSSEQIKQALSRLATIGSDAPDYPQSLLLRAYMHRYGQGGAVDLVKAIELYEQAIALGNGLAMVERANMHLYGKSGVVDFVKAIELYERAMALGFSAAMNNRAHMHLRGKGGAVDLVKAIELYEQAIALGDCTAMNNRAYMHRKGVGGAVDLVKAIELYEQAIALGNSSAMNNRASMYEEGQGGAVDLDSACRLYYQAYNADDSTQSLNNLQRLAKEHVPSAQKNLILIYLHTTKMSEAQSLYNTNSASINPLLFAEVCHRLDTEPESALTEELVDFMRTNLAKKPSCANQLAYLQLKLWLTDEKTSDALALYQKSLRDSAYLTGYDFFRLGNAVLTALEGAALARKIKHLEQACYFFHLGHQCGDKDCYTLLIKLLRDKEALEQDKTSQDAYKLINEKDATDKALIDRFTVTWHLKTNKRAKAALTAFIITETSYAEKASRSRFFFHGIIRQRTALR